MTFETMQHFADSWGLIYMVGTFVAVLAFTLRPGAKQSARDAAQIPFNENEDKPVP